MTIWKPGLLLGFAAALFTGAVHAETRVVIGTAGTAGALYPMGVAIAETINRHSELVSASAEASAGSLENIRNLSSGELQWAISANEVAYAAYNGLGDYDGMPIAGLQSLFSVFPNYVQIFTAADSDLKSIGDFEGKRIGVGAPGSGGERTAAAILEYYGLGYDNVDEQFLGNSDMVSALKDGQIDGFILTHPLRSALLLDLTSGFETRLIGIDDPAFYETFPFFIPTSVPTDTYDGVADEATVPASRIVMYTSTESGLTDDEIYDMLNTMWSNIAEWQDVHAAVKANMRLETALEGLAGIPLHPSAERFYTEKGLAIP